MYRIETSPDQKLETTQMLGIGLSLSLGVSRLRGSTSPLALFANGEIGLWLDISDPATVFSDLAGATQAGIGDPVALVLDKSRGLALGPELVVNGGFDTGDLTGWLDPNNHWSVSDGAAFHASSSAFNMLLCNVQSLAGKYVRLSFDVSGYSGTGGVRVQWRNADQSAYTISLPFSDTGLGTAPSIKSDGAYVWHGTIPAFVSFLSFARDTGSNAAEFSIDNISVRELPGYHATQSTLASRPILGRVPATGRRNVLTLTESMDQWNTLSGEVIVTPSAETAPEGQAFLIAGTNGGSSGLGRLIDVFGSATRDLPESCVVTFWAKRVTGERPLEYLSGGNRTSYPDLPNDGQWHSISAPVDIGAFQFLTRWTSSEILVSAPQLELGSVATPYQRVGSQYDVTEAGVPSLRYLRGNGVNTFMTTPVITPGTDKVQVFAGVRKLSDAATGMVAELGDSGNGVFFLAAPRNTARYDFASKGDGSYRTTGATDTSFDAPHTAILTGAADIGADMLRIRVQGGQISESTAAQGTGNYLAYPFYIGARAGTSLFFNGDIFSLIVRFGPNLDAATIERTERYVANKTGVQL